MPIPIELKQLCDRRKLTLAVAESASAGHMSTLVASVSGSSSFFEGGVIAYSIRQKVKHLGVDLEHAQSVGCVSERVAKEMASGVRAAFGTTIGLSITGYAEPVPSLNIDDRFCWIGFDVNGIVWAERCEGPEAAWLDGHDLRKATQEHFAWMALEGLVNYLNAQ